MTRRIHPFRVPIALAAACLLVAACSETAADDDTGAAADPQSSGSSPAEDRPTEESRSPAAQIALPDGVLPLPAPDADGEAPPLDAGRYQILLSDTLALEIDLAQGSYAHDDGLYLESKDASILKVEAAGETYGVPVHPCTDQFAQAVGPTVPDLVEAIREEPVYRVSRPEPVEIGGAEGTYLEIRVPKGYDASSCTSSQVGMPGNPSTSNNMPPGYVGGWWILDAAGQRVVVQRFCDQCGVDVLERVAKTVRGITFTPAT